MRVRYLLKRIIYIIPVAFGVTIVIFLLLHLMPGDPAASLLGPDATPDELERVRVLLGLNENIFVQLFAYISQLVQFNFGDSIQFGMPVADILKTAIPATLELAVVSLIITLLIAIPLGILSAVKQNTWIDRCCMFFAQVGISMPLFWMSMLLILLFSVNLNWLPSFGRGEPLLKALGILINTGDGAVLVNSLKKIAMPAVSLGIMGSALISRMVRSTMLEVLDLDYIRTAYAKGSGKFRVIMKHAFRNALLPVITIVGLQFGFLLGGSIVTETVFAWPGAGQIIVKAISARDYPLVQGLVFCLSMMFVGVNLLVDLLYALINPKINQG